MGANQSSKAQEGPHQFDATSNYDHNNIETNQNKNNKLSFRKQHMKLFNKKPKSQLLTINNPDELNNKSSSPNRNGKSTSKIISNESQHQPASKTIEPIWNASLDATNELKSAYYVSNDGRKLMQSNNYAMMQQANKNGHHQHQQQQQKLYHEIDQNFSNGSDHLISDRLVGATNNTLGRRSQQLARTSSEVRDSSKLLNNNNNNNSCLKDHHQRERQHQHQQQLNSNGHSLSNTNAITNSNSNNDRNNCSQTSGSYQQQLGSTSSPSDHSFIPTTSTPATKHHHHHHHHQQLLNNSVPYHLSRAVNSKTSNVLNNNSQQPKNNNYNYNHDSHNNNNNNNAVAMTNASNGIASASKHHNHQRASSESWSKHHHQQMVLAALQQQQQQQNQTNNFGHRQAYQRQANLNHINTSTNGHQSLNTTLGPYGAPVDSLDHQQVLNYGDNIENSYYDEIVQHEQDFGDDLEQYYSRNLHLLDQQKQHPYQQSAHNSGAEFANNQQLYNSNNPSVNNQIPTTDFATHNGGHMSAPLQRRYKWPKQQYQYLNQAATEQHQAYQTQQLNPVKSQAQFAITPASFSSNQIKPFDNYNRSYSFEFASRRKNSHGKSKNPLAALFNHPSTNNNSSQNTLSSANPHEHHQQQLFKKYSKTVHLSSSKSHQTLSTSSSVSQRASCPSGGSLKRIKSSPLTAQQASYEAMRTIDMYLIRQIARSCMDQKQQQQQQQQQVARFEYNHFAST